MQRLLCNMQNAFRRFQVCLALCPLLFTLPFCCCWNSREYENRRGMMPSSLILSRSGAGRQTSNSSSAISNSLLISNEDDMRQSFGSKSNRMKGGKGQHQSSRDVLRAKPRKSAAPTGPTVYFFLFFFSSIILISL